MAKLVKIETTDQMAFTPPSGYITSTIGEVEGQITELVKKSDGTIVTIGGGGGGGGSDAYVVVDDNGVLKAQKLSFNGTEASFDGTAETLDATKVGLFATTQDEPAYKGSGGGGAFYKCASVDTTAKTWTGYLAVLGEDGIYSFEETVTEGLTYTSVTPSVGKVYTEDALVTVFTIYTGVPTDGLIFYAPFVDSIIAETGQSLSLISGSYNFTDVDGIPCVSGDGTQLQCSLTAPEKFTICLWVKAAGSTRANIGDGSRGTLTLEVADNAINSIEQMVSVIDTVDSYNSTMLSCFIWTFESGSQQIWKDGVLLSTSEYVPSSSPNDVMLCDMSGSVTHLRIYDRILTEDEIKIVSDEL